MMLPTIVLVGADKGGVGKTMITRALVDYLRVRNATYVPFDTEVGAQAGVLKRFVPTAELCDIGLVKGQMQIFDAVKDNTFTVVDLRAGMLTPTLAALRNSGMMGDVREGKARMLLLHILGSTVASMQEVSAVMAQMQGAMHILVQNHAIPDASFSGVGQSTLPSLVIPNLNEDAAEAVDLNDSSFLQFSLTAGSRVLRGYVKTWLDAVFLEFDKLRLSSFQNTVT